MQELENRMVVDTAWEWNEAPAAEILNRPESSGCPGYTNIRTGEFVPLEDALAYALEKTAQDATLRREFVEYFYSGNWVKEAL